MKQLNKSTLEELNLRIEKAFGVSAFFDKKESLASVEIDGKQFYLKDKQPLFFTNENLLIPSLRLLLQRQFLKTITVDMGAIPFVTKGADVMRPGITEITPTVAQNELVCVIDKNHHKPLAVAQALFPAAEMQAMQKGRVLKNLHYVGDDVWKIAV